MEAPEREGEKASKNDGTESLKKKQKKKTCICARYGVRIGRHKLTFALKSVKNERRGNKKAKRKKIILHSENLNVHNVGSFQQFF